MRVVSWWWVRHAPTGARGAIGWTDIAADTSDSAALQHLCDALPQAPVISSDLRRARDTAERIRGARRDLGADPALRELHFGAWEGLDFATIAARWPNENAAWWADPASVGPPGGESFAALQARVRARVAALNGELGSGDVVAVAHMGAILAALAIATGMDARQVLGFRIDPLSVTRLDWLPEAGCWRVGGVNLRRLSAPA